jgi:mannitol-specific phosphotransferase system IIBC component
MMLAATPEDNAYVAAIVGAFAGSAVTALVSQIYYKRLIGKAERHVVEAAQVIQSHQGTGAKRDEVMFEQQKHLNQLMISKIQTEIELMRGQAMSREDRETRESAAKEYHELMVEKTKLEMDSMRLHIAEVRKRLDDWNISDPD